MVLELMVIVKPRPRRVVFLLALFALAGQGVASRAPRRLAGRVPASLHRPTPASPDPAVEALLAQYRTRPEAFDWDATWRGEDRSYDLYDVRFPSPIQTEQAELNTVWCEYFRAKGDAKRPAVVLLHILGPGDFTLERVMAVGFVTAGIDVALMKMPYYAQRRPKRRGRAGVATNIDTLVAAVQQGACDARRTAEWLSSLPWVDRKRLGVCGISLGAFVAATAAGVDGNFARAGFVLGGGDVAGVLWNGSREVRRVTAQVKRLGYTRETLAEKVRIVDPNTFASRLTRTDILMINGRRDRVVPPACTLSFWRAAGRPRIIWYNCGHYDDIIKIFEIIDHLRKHLGR